MTEDKPNWPTEAEVRASFPPPRYRLVGYDIGTAPDENGGWVHWTDHEAIVARLTAERDAALAGGVKVKPLVWVGDDFCQSAQTSFGDYVVQDEDDDGWGIWYPNENDCRGPDICERTEEAAKAAAQADYEARIRAALQPDPDARQADLSAAARDVLAERARQISAEGWTPEHDDAYKAGELASAAGAYALYAASDSHHREALDIRNNPQRSRPYGWPWSKEWWKPTDPRRDLVKAAALILAEIERLDRALTPPADLAAKIGGAE